jgi:transposase
MLDNNFNIEPTDAVGLFKYKVIAPLLDADEVYITAMVKEISSRTFTDEVKGRQVRVSERTVYRWLSLYKKYGFNSLKPVAKGTKGKFKVFSKELIEKITDIKTKNIKVSARKIIFMLEKSGNVEKDMLKERTVSRLLNVLGYTRSALSSGDQGIQKACIYTDQPAVAGRCMREISSVQQGRQHDQGIPDRVFRPFLQEVLWTVLRGGKPCKAHGCLKAICHSDGTS